MPYVEVAITVNSSSDEIYSILSDMTKYPDFMPDLLSVELIERTGNTTITKWVSNVDGRIITWTEIDTFNDQEKHIHYRQIEGDLKKFEGAWLLSPSAEGTEVRLTVDFEFGIPMISGLLNPILKKKVRDNSMNMLTAIKARLENKA